ncbi:DUF5071 domain-containing protein [Paenibacillus sp. ACRRX]|uniref:DUF5071 domain-containing protein n=1 Tax=Paenibacillus sp. ACRRX TaxID=2918206 RepID=UPI001EF52947|nr:DUF5071 domain-containing protein [Paenibacillus sp. ACRRX]MCG7409658.1 DUF5071 domain-containing protein [Paenibacillus sp. ACRRX]
MEHKPKYLPRDKHDFESVNELFHLDPPIIVPLIPRLVEWLQDINWPIASDVAKLLLKYPEETIPHIKAVLNSKDDIWKNGCLLYFVQKLPELYISQFKNEVTRIVTDPTQGELLEEVNETAKRIFVF